VENSDILIHLFVLFAAARILGETFQAMKQPAVVGELLAGVLVGPYGLGLVGGEGETLVLEVIAELGVIILLFTVGLETSLGELRQVGRPAVLVGTIGVVLPFALGVGLMLGLDYENREALFVAAALVATSVGVTARVLRDFGAVRTVVARVVLGAAVVDDILAILVLAVVAGLARGGISELGLTVTFLEVLVFLVIVVFAGPGVVRKLSDFMHLPIVPGSPFAFAVLLTLGLAALSGVIGLASIIGAFLAGLIFEIRKDEVATQIEPVYEFLVPFFFAVTGTHLDPSVFADGHILGLAAGVTFIAVVAKVAAGLLGGRQYGRFVALTIGVGMIPRAEVGLIVAAFGLRLGVISSDLYGVVVVMTVVTTIMTPPILSAMLKRHTLETPELAGE
jgi:Kef-type K+ transport system membrane component KefB